MKSLSELRDGIKARLEAEGRTTNVLFGRAHLHRRDGQGPGTANRVVIAPGTPDGQRGAWGAPTHVHRAPPDRMRHRRWVTVQIWSYDGTAPIDEAAQDDALEALVQCVMRAAHDVVLGDAHHTVGEVPGIYEAEESYPLAPTERRHGDMCQVVFWVDFSVRPPTPATEIAAEPTPVTPVVQQAGSVPAEESP